MADDRQSAATAYSTRMRGVLLILLALDMLAVIGVLMAGVLGMANPERNPRRANLLMRWRVILQGVAILLVVALMVS
ncbi:twin transmembrane helix small protein [Acidocella aminolytica]|uniref:twin transmembrane helix small protein n=1 Tax=Acidocella aminolytica TaxID=33998 RepID=UPI00091F0573|nr:twin transmembrane helix small protein [Acidocella aminolytica]SHF20724.1 Hypoxia induced protein conserved region [Acidocella aminolytica 101 = DSM 11237]